MDLDDKKAKAKAKRATTDELKKRIRATLSTQPQAPPVQSEPERGILAPSPTLDEAVAKLSPKTVQKLAGMSAASRKEFASAQFSSEEALALRQAGVDLDTVEGRQTLIDAAQAQDNASPDQLRQLKESRDVWREALRVAKDELEDLQREVLRLREWKETVKYIFWFGVAFSVLVLAFALVPETILSKILGVCMLLAAVLFITYKVADRMKWI